MVQCAIFRFAFYVDWTAHDNNQFADLLSKKQVQRFENLCQFNKISINSECTVNLQ